MVSLCTSCSLLLEQMWSSNWGPWPCLRLLLMGYVRSRTGCSSALRGCGSLISIPISRSVTMPLPPAICFSNTFRELFFLRGSQVVNVDPIQQTFGIDRLQYLLLHVL